MDCFPSYGRRFVRGSIVTALLLGAAAVPNAGAQVSQERPPQNNGSTTSSRTSVLLFDASSLSLNDAQVFVNSALRWVETRADGELTAIVTTGAKVNVISDFTADGVELGNVLRSEAFLAAIVRTGPGQRAIRFGADATSRAAAQDATVQPDDPEVAEARLRGVATVCQTTAPIRQRKAILYLSAGLLTSGTSRSSLSVATDACNRAGVSVLPIDVRGLVAVTPGATSRP